jgi:hypothetical protein
MLPGVVLPPESARIRKPKLMLDGKNAQVFVVDLDLVV